MAKRHKAEAKNVPAKKPEPFFRPFSKLAPLAREPAKAPAPPPPPPPAPPKPPPELERMSDAETFAIHMAGVDALSPDRGQRIPKTSSKIERAPAPRGPVGDPDAEARAALHALVDGDAKGSPREKKRAR
jgi:hypothetical protein